MSELDRKADKNRINGVGKEIEGKVRNAVGGITGDSSEQLKGKAQELKGKAQRKLGDAQDDVDDADREVNRRNRDDDLL